MPDVTFRIAWSNLVSLANSIIVASSEQASYPASNLRQSGLSNGWRSRIGWNVVTGFNDRFDFSEGGVDRNATLAAGNYATGELFAAELQTKMNAAAVNNTYTVTYSTSTKKFTIARATGATAFNLEWQSGANAATGCGKDIGFVVTADDTGATTYTSDNPSYHSRSYLKIDCGSAQTAGSLHLVEHSAWSAGASLTLAGNATDAWTSPSYSGTISQGAALSALWFTPVAYRYWRIVIDDCQNSNAFTFCKVVVLAPYLELSRGVQKGYGRAAADPSGVVQTYGGGMVQAKRAVPLSMSIPFRKLRKTEQAALIQMNNDFGVGRPMIISMDPQNYPTEAKYMALASPIKMQHTFGDGNPPERWDTTIDLIEVKA